MSRSNSADALSKTNPENQTSNARILKLGKQSAQARLGGLAHGFLQREPALLPEVLFGKFNVISRLFYMADKSTLNVNNVVFINHP